MIRTLKNLKPGKYVADYRYDEGIRIRDSFVSPTLTLKLGGGGTEGLSSPVYLIEVLENDEENKSE